MRVAATPFARGIDAVVIYRYTKLYSLIHIIICTVYTSSIVFEAPNSSRPWDSGEKGKRDDILFSIPRHVAACWYIYVYVIAREERLRVIPIYDNNKIYLHNIINHGWAFKS